MSDHGEGLGDHGESEHGVFLYREVLQVPLLVKLPKGGAPAPRTVAAPVQLADLFTTIGRAAGLEGFAAPAGTVSVIDVADAPRQPARRIYAESFFPRTHFGWSELRSLVDGRWHYIEAPRPELFDLAADPAEKIEPRGRPARAVPEDADRDGDAPDVVRGARRRRPGNGEEARVARVPQLGARPRAAARWTTRRTTSRPSAS